MTLSIVLGLQKFVPPRGRKTVRNGFEKPKQTDAEIREAERKQAIQQENIEKVFRAIQAGYSTLPEIQREAGLSDSTVGKAIRFLQDTGRIRVTMVKRKFCEVA